MRKSIDYSLYLCTDRKIMSVETLEVAVEQAILGGCTVVQLREKECSSLEFYNTAVSVKRVTEKYKIPLIIDDRADIAVAVDADGVHIGQNDLPAKVVRKIVGEKKIVGVTAATVEKALKAQADGADYIGVGAVFPTGTKSNAKQISMETFCQIRENVNIPIVAIGGINSRNIRELRGYGADGFAVVSAVISKPNIKMAAEELSSIIHSEKILRR